MARPTNCILVVEDEPDLLSEVADYLCRRGLDVLQSGSFSEAVRMYQDNAASISLVLTSGRMPDGNGFDLMRRVLDHSRGKCPCLLMTGRVEQAAPGDDLASAGVRILHKPFSMSALFDSIMGALNSAAEHVSLEPIRKVLEESVR